MLGEGRVSLYCRSTKKKLTRRDRFLSEIDSVTPCGKLHSTFVGIDLGRESAPEATTLLKFRHLLEAKGLTREIFDTINGHLAEKGLMMREGTIVDATLIAAPPSTKNGKRDPKMHQSRKLKSFFFLQLLNN